MTWTVSFPVLLHLAKIPFLLPGPAQMLAVAKLCPGAPGTVNHVLLHVLSVLYSYCYRGTDHIWMCLVLYVPFSATRSWASWAWRQFSCLLLDFSALSTLSTHSRWLTPKWRLLSDVVRTLSLKPRMPLSSGATFDNSPYFSKLAFSSEKENSVRNAQHCCEEEMEY